MRTTWLGLALLVAAGCGDGGDDEPVVPVEPLREVPLEVVTGAPAMAAEAPEETEIGLDPDVTGLAAIGSELWIGTAEGALRLEGEAAALAEIWGDEPGTPATTGAIRALARRTEDLLVVGNEGLFVSEGSRLLWSPASAALGELSIADVHVEGDVVWIAASSGLYRATGGELERWVIEGAAGAPTAVLDTGSVVLVAFGDRLFELDVQEPSAVGLELDFGAVHAMAMGHDVAWLATDAGLVARREDGWVQHTLSDDAQPVRVSDLALDPKEGLYAATDSGILIAREGGDIEGLVPLEAASGAAHLTTDDSGIVWLGAGSALRGWTLGTPISFASDVRPVLSEYCAVCHAPPGENDAPPIDWTDLDVALEHRLAVLERLATGQMPPASAEPLPADARELVLRWYASGAKP